MAVATARVSLRVAGILMCAAATKIKRNAWDWAGAEREYTRALELNPNHVEAHNGYATFLSVVGRHEQAIAEGQRARELDPLYPFTTINLGHVLYFARRYDLAIAALSRQLELDPTSHLASFYLGPVYAPKAIIRRPSRRHSRR